MEFDVGDLVCIFNKFYFDANEIYEITNIHDDNATFTIKCMYDNNGKQLKYNIEREINKNYCKSASIALPERITELQTIIENLKKIYIKNTT